MAGCTVIAARWSASMWSPVGGPKRWPLTGCKTSGISCGTSDAASRISSGSVAAAQTILHADSTRAASSRKRTVVEGMAEPLWDAFDRAEKRYLHELMELEDAHEGLAAFLEKREPVWSDA